MKACNCYEVVMAETVDELNEAVHKKIADGMLPCGGVAITPEGDTHYYHLAQAMCAPSTLVNTAGLKFLRSTIEAAVLASIKKAKNLSEKGTS